MTYTADYNPYGEPLASSGDGTTNLGFTGEHTDKSGLTYLRARYLNTATGTFLTTDPVMGMIGSRAMQWNPYLYVGANPVNYLDPSGEFLPLGAIVVGIVVGAAIGAAVNLAAQIIGNLINDRPWDCIDWNSVAVSAMEGAIMGAIGGGLGAIGNMARYSNISRFSKFVLTEAADFAIGMAWDITVHGDTPSEALVGNLLAIGISSAVELRGARNVDVDAHSVDVNSRAFDGYIDIDGRRLGYVDDAATGTRHLEDGRVFGIGGGGRVHQPELPGMPPRPTLPPNVRPDDSPFYSVVYETELTPGKHYPGRSRGRHNAIANEQLYDDIVNDPHFGSTLENEYPGLKAHVTPGSRGAFSREAPPGLTWHHSPYEPGRLQLTITAEHQSPGPIQDSLHPGGRGGFNIWGR